MPYYITGTSVGLKDVSSFGDGNSINLRWYRAYPSNTDGYLAYNIYYSTEKQNVFNEGVKYVYIDIPTDSNIVYLEANIINLKPGQEYFFSVRPVEYDSSMVDIINNLPIAYDNLRIYPSSSLAQDISAIDTIIPILDLAETGFAASGLVKIDSEIIKYNAIDYTHGNLIVNGGSYFDGYTITAKRFDGYNSGINIGDGYIVNFSFTENSIIEDWRITCVFVQRDINGNLIPGTAKFEAIGSISGCKLDGYAYHPFMKFYTDGYSNYVNYINGYSNIGDFVIWNVNNQNTNNDITFGIYENNLHPFIEGDGFLISIDKSAIDGGRGYNSKAKSHLQRAVVEQYAPEESQLFDNIYACQCRFEYPNYALIIPDGYHQIEKDILTTDLSASDNFNVGFRPYDYAGYHRTDPVQLLNGTCVGSYIGGEQYCIDKNGVAHITRGFSLQEQMNQREEMLLSLTGRQVVLIQKVQTGITCSCFQPSSEYADDRCPYCLGSKFVIGWNQYFDPRRPDGRIMVRPGPAEDNLKMYESGLESEFPLELWTLTVPTIKNRDIIVMFDMDNNEEFRYEVIAVTRNNTIIGLQGGQKLRVQRIRKTDPAYQIRVFRDTSKFPSKLNTSIGSVVKNGNIVILPHAHEIVINENIVNINQINQITSIVHGHSHVITMGEIYLTLGHTHTIII